MTDSNEPIVTRAPDAILVERVLKLESQIRWAKKFGAVATLVVAALLIVGQAPGANAQKVNATVPDIIAARKFIVVDEQGRERAMLGVDGNKTVLAMRNGRKQTGILASVNMDSDLSSFEVKSGGFEASMSAHFDLGGLFFVGRDGKPKIRLASAATISALVISDREQEGRVFVAVDEGTDSAQLRICDPAGNARAVLGTTHLVTTSTGAQTKTAESSLVLYDKDANVIFEAPIK